MVPSKYIDVTVLILLEAVTRLEKHQGLQFINSILQLNHNFEAHDEVPLHRSSLEEAASHSRLVPPVKIHGGERHFWFSVAFLARGKLCGDL